MYIRRSSDSLFFTAGPAEARLAHAYIVIVWVIIISIDVSLIPRRMTLDECGAAAVVWGEARWMYAPCNLLITNVIYYRGLLFQVLLFGDRFVLCHFHVRKFNVWASFKRNDVTVTVFMTPSHAQPRFYFNSMDKDFTFLK